MAAFAPPFGRGTRGQHFTVFQSQPPGRQPFGRKVKSPRAFGPAPLPEGGPHPTQGGNVSPDSAANSGRAGLTPPSLAQRLRENASYPGASGGPDSAANSGRDGPTPPRWKAVAPHGGPGGSPAALCHFLSAEKVMPGLPVRPEYYSNESLAQRQSLATFF